MAGQVRWRKGEQTECKHSVLRRYLDGWFPILGSAHRRLLFVDGFAGPGEYKTGEIGSPIVALDCVQQHRAESRLANVEVTCLFIEKNKRRAKHLQQLLDARPEDPETSSRVLTGEFDAETSELLNAIDLHKKILAPSFFMIDPFGVKGNRMDSFRRILKNQRSEIFFSFMYEPIRRFKKQPEFEKPLTELFGTEEWKKVLGMNESKESKRFLHGLFTKQLKSHGARFVVDAEVWRKKRHIYTIYFATNNVLGCNLMKEVIWKEQPTGSYRLHADANERLLLFEPDMKPLERQLWEKFGDRWVRIEVVEKFVMGDETRFHRNQLRKKTLTPMLEGGRLERRPPNAKSFANDRGIEVRFLPPE